MNYTLPGIGDIRGSDLGPDERSEPREPTCRDCGCPCDACQCDECRLGLCSVCGVLLAEGDWQRDECCADCRDCEPERVAAVQMRGAEGEAA